MQATRARATRPRSKRASGGRPPSGAARKRASLGAFAADPEPAGGGADGHGVSMGAAGGVSSALEAAAAGAVAATSGDGGGGGGSSGEDASESSGGRKVRWAAGMCSQSARRM